ncbi:MAG: SIR2 family protein, partial [Bacteroides sp.]|nr:SIR2 family protein [Bacteroides sp.]
HNSIIPCLSILLKIDFRDMGISAGEIYLPSTLAYGDNVINAIRSGQKCLIKLHGTANQAESIILTEDTFNNTYKHENTALINIVDYLWNRAALLFLGCGLKKDYLIEHLNTLANSSKTNWHYAILPYPEKDEVKKRKRQLLKLKIRPIWYQSGKYEQIYMILQAIIGSDGSKGTDEYKNKTIKEDIIKQTSKFAVTNNGNVGTQKTINIGSLNGKIIL